MKIRSRTTLTAVLAVALLASACGGSAVPDDGPVVMVEVPSPGPRQPAIATLEPVPTPTPVPPTPTPVPLAPPQGALIRAASGEQVGAGSSYCWTAGDQGSCQDHPPPSQTAALTVRQKEAVLLVIDADRPPTSETIRPFQGDNRRDQRPQPVDPALETSLVVDLPPGEWNLDLCASWTGHGQPCWLFRLEVVEG